MTLIQNLRDCADVSLVGGKAANLGALLRAGFAVPEGFVMTTAARDADTEAVRDAYNDLTAPAVAVRSSATVEDSADLSTAGQFNTVLNVRSEAELLDAVRLCRASSDSPSARAYLRENHASGAAAMAVVVQRQIPADVAGVLFTETPERPDEMLIEANPGLGENVVSGRMQPDAYWVNVRTGEIIAKRSARETPSLSERDVARLWSLGREVASHLGSPQDIEWAIADGELFLLQSRPITTSDRSVIRKAMIEAARDSLTQSQRGPWILHNLAETLPHPTPLTWSVLRRFMSGAGGFGAMYRRLGFQPAGAEFLELILGKIYMDLSRAPGLFGEDFPFAYDRELLRRDPGAAQLPPSISRGSWWARLKARRQMAAAQRKIDIESLDFDQRLNEQIIPSFVAWCAQEKTRDLSLLSTEDWIALWHELERRVFDEFAPEIFFTNFIAASALKRLRDFVAEHFWDESPDALTQMLSSSGMLDRTTLCDAALRDVAQDRLSVEAWLAEYGHRAIGEFDLAAPRWREMPEALSTYAVHLREAPDPLALDRQRTEHARTRIAQLPTRLACDLRERAELARRYLNFREDGKHYLMLGYDLLRDMVLDAAHRLNGDVVWLNLDELTVALRNGCLPQALVTQRKREYRAEARIPLPHLIDAAALSTLGEAPPLEDHERFPGLTISSGFASGPVRIVESPLEATKLGHGYVLVCPSTDPQWTPLFLNAAAVVLECGGSLSHGAIVARELNLPAVVLPDATRLLRDGETIFVDGSTGVISRKAGDAKPDLNDTSIAPEKFPPVPGQRERRAARVRSASFVFWGLSLLAAWRLPKHWIYLPSLHFLDQLFWPAVRSFGRPVAVAIIGVGFAFLAALTQALLVDNARLREARRRARALTIEAAALPIDSPRRRALMSIFGAVHLRIIGAGLVPVGILLGVFVLSFTWLAARMDRSAPLPGSAARVLVTIGADFQDPVAIAVNPPLRLDESSLPTRSLPPIRETLDRLASQRNLSEVELADLRRYLQRGVPPQTLAWIVRSDRPGSFPIQVVLGKVVSAQQSVVFGDESPPPDDKAIRHSPLHSIKVEAMEPKPAFWNSGPRSRILNRYFDWPWVYLASYLIVWLLLRRFFRLV